jgi:uncharacterized protein Yka (UPF0111/DUF47 family)
MRERAADEIVVEVRSLVERIPDAGAFRDIVEIADDAADELEEAVFDATLMPVGAVLGDDARATLKQLAEYAGAASDAWAACLQSARHARHGSPGTDVRALLEEVDRLVTIERETDDAERRAVTELLVAPAADARVLFVATELVRHLETSTDALLHAALLLRDHTLGAAMVERN